MRFSIIFAGLFLASILRGQPLATLKWQGKKDITLAGYLSIWEDAKGTLTIEDIIKDTTLSNWQPYASDYLMCGYRNSYIWLRLDIDFDSIPLNSMYWWFDIPYPQAALFYQVTNGHILKTSKTSINDPFSQREVANRALIFPFSPQKGKTILYARLHNDVGSMFGYARLHTVNDFAVIDNQLTRKWSFFFAFVLFSALLNLGLWVVFNERVYAYYGAYLCCTALMMISVNGFGSEWFWQNSPVLANASKVIWTFGMGAFLTRFIYALLFEALKSNKYLPIIINIQTGLLILSCLIALGFQYVPKQYLPNALIFGNFVIYFTILIIGYMLFKGIAKRNMPAYYFLAAFMPVILMGSAYYARNAGLIKSVYLQSPFSIVPAFCFEIILLFIALLMRFKVYSKMKKEQLQMEKEAQNRLQNERERISRDLHDNMGAQLSHIVRSVEWFSKHGNIENDVEKDLLDNVNVIAKEAITTLRESIWTLNKEKISVEDFVERYKKWAIPLLKSAPQTTLIFQENIEKNNVLTPEQSLQLFRILQEALNNGLKHADATNIQLRTESNENHIISLIFSDNGRGFDVTNTLENGNGLINMQQRAEGIGATFELNTAPKDGTMIIVSLVVGH